MKLVIEIDEVRFKDIQRIASVQLERSRFQTAEQVIANGTPLPKGLGRIFEEIVVEYPPAELCTYPEYRGKPYFSIKYEENGKHFIGFGTYKPKVLSSYLREYFIAPTIIEADTESEDVE